MSAGAGPLAGVRIVEFAGMGPAPFGAMLLADLGAEVVRIDRGDEAVRANLVRERGRSALTLDLKSTAGLALAIDALACADVLIEGFRPGVMERLGLGPDVALARNPRLIYARMTGWGQTGPLAQTAGHDLTYIAPTGALDAITPGGARPRPPLNLVGDFGGGALYLALGIVSALYERDRSGLGQVIDAAIVDGTASMLANFSGMSANGERALDHGRRLLGGDAPNYSCYACADGGYVAVGAIEEKFVAALLRGLELDPALGDGVQPAAIAAAFATRPRDAWVELFAATDACVAPVLSVDEAPAHPHLRSRAVYVELEGEMQPAPAPRFSRTPGAVRPRAAGGAGRDVLRRWGVGAA